MKVLVCIPCLLTGGTEVQTLSLVEALIAAGHSPIVACYFEYNTPMVERYRQAGADVRLLSSAGMRPSGIKDTATFLWKELKPIVKTEKPEVAHMQYMAPGALPILILKLLGVRHIIATTHTDGNIYSPNGLRMIRFLSKYVLDALQCITEEAEKSYFGSSKLFDGNLTQHLTIYNNIPSNISILTAPRKAKLMKEPITIGVVSRLEPIKGTDLVIPAFVKALKHDERLHLLVVGDGSQREFMERQSRESGALDRISFVGRKNQSDLQDYYDRIDILLMPSRSEGFGLTAIEGMARGCVPVVAATGGLREVVTSDSGYLHIPEDTDDIADKIIEAAQSWHNKSAGALHRASAFTPATYQYQIKCLYRSL